MSSIGTERIGTQVEFLFDLLIAYYQPDLLKG